MAADDLRPDEQGVLEVGLHRVALVLRIVGIHENEGAGLQLAVNAASGLQREAAGSGAGHQPWRNALGLEQLAR